MVSRLKKKGIAPLGAMLPLYWPCAGRILQIRLERLQNNKRYIFQSLGGA